MMKPTIFNILSILLLCFFCHSTALSQHTYRYEVDLIQVDQDQVEVSLFTPAIKKKTVIFQLPRIIPGSYSVTNFGAYVQDLRAFDKAGKSLKVKQLDPNSWEISTAKKLYRLIYRVNDS